MLSVLTTLLCTAAAAGLLAVAGRSAGRAAAVAAAIDADRCQALAAQLQRATTELGEAIDERTRR